MNNDYLTEHEATTEASVSSSALPSHFSDTTTSPTPTVIKSCQTGSIEENTPGEKVPNTSTDPESGPPTKKRRMEGRGRCVRCLCCACCLPVWATGILWFIIISIIIVVAVLGGILGTLSMPTVEMVGITSSPTFNSSSQISFSGDSVDINFGLIVQINNTNLFSIDLRDITATAYYPTSTGEHMQIGGGYLPEHLLPKYSNTNITFPFALEYNPMLDTDQSVLTDLVNKCGLVGGSKSDITINYTIKVTAVVFTIKVHPTISSSATFPCPIDEATSSLNIGNKST